MRSNLSAAHAATMRELRDNGIDTPALDARVLLMSATGLSVEALIARGRDPFPRAAEKRLVDFVSRRLAGEPVSRIRGMREFYGREFLIDPNTLDPRADTETLIEAVLEVLARQGDRKKPVRILDLGTGSGCILVTLLSELPEARGVGVDISWRALRIARQNARCLGVGDRAGFLTANWFEGLQGQFDLIVSNPPYIAHREIDDLPREVGRYDPVRALDGGLDGLDAYRDIARSAACFLRPGGHLLVEIAPTQADDVAGLFQQGGLIVPTNAITVDLGGRPRCVYATRSDGEGTRPG